MFCQVAQAALQVWAKGSRAAEVLLDTSTQERIDLEAALKGVLLPHLSKMSAEAFQVRLLLCQHRRTSLVMFRRALSGSSMFHKCIGSIS